MSLIEKILSGEILQNEFLRKNLRFLVLIFSLFFVFVIIGAIGSFKVASIQELKNEITDLKEESVFMQSELMHASLINEVDAEVKKRNIGLNKLSKPPKIIEINSNEDTSNER